MKKTTKGSLSWDEIQLFSRHLSQHTHVKQETHSEISRDPAAPTLHRTVSAGENSLWEIHDSGEKDVMGQQGKKAFEQTEFMWTGWISKQLWKMSFIQSSAEDLSEDNWKKTCEETWRSSINTKYKTENSQL